MSEHFNKLSPAEAERLALLLEEMGEAQQAIGKILRHGYESGHPDGGPKNRHALEREMGDVQAALQLLYLRGDLVASHVVDAMHQKYATVERYLHHNIVPFPREVTRG